MPNKLQLETSPYLLQHANNPVDWNAWGDDALALAAAHDKPILLSIGYSACHWCHVMERESFEDAAIAARMNELFVCIKVDREERPDLDKIYQTAHQMLAQRPGGWPLTVALTPRGHAPFFAGTYFPPQPRMGMPGFGEVLEKVAAHYTEHRAQMDDHHRAFAEAMAQLNPAMTVTNATVPPSSRALKKATQELSTQFDWTFGGFGNAPKFPHPTQLELLLRADGDETSRFLNLSLRKMAEGGLFDHLGGGFFRYSVDRQWCIPHFEKMLYDNAQLLTVYSDAYRHHREPFYRAVAEQTAEWVMREMQQAHGGYASTLDADSEGAEGKYYVWSETDLRALLDSDEYAAVETRYGLVGEPNFEGEWHFNIRASDGDDDRDRDGDALARAQRKLFSARQQRIRPALDDKVLTAWNGLMIKGMARAAVAFARADFAKSACAALDFIRGMMWRDGRLSVTSRNGEARLNGYLDDYAFLAEGIVDLLQAKWRDEDLTFAVDICDAMLTHFYDADAGGFFFTSHDHEQLLHRPKSGADDAIPAGNAAAVRALCKLGHLLGETKYLTCAEKTLTLFADALEKTPSVYGALCMAIQSYEPHTQIILRGDEKTIRDWQKICQHQLTAAETLTLAIPATAHLPPSLAQRKPRGAAVAYICHGTKCSAAIETVAELKKQLAQHSAN